MRNLAPQRTPEPQEIIGNLINSIQTVILGKTQQIEQIVSCWLAGGHVLIEDSPGTGKTMLARALANSAQVKFNRVQFTPDLLPADILGSSIYEPSNQQFKFHEGPLFSTVFLGDEINRATPRTQSALLEAMAEGQITVDGITHPLNPLFFVLATQNPIEQYGTFPLPEAQLDRFMMKLSLGYPTPAEEIKIIQDQRTHHPINDVKQVITEEWLLYLRDLAKNVEVNEKVYRYVMTIISKTRENPYIKIGASPRATIALVKAAQATALVEGSSYVTPKHIFNLVTPILGHRLILSGEAKLSQQKPSEILADILKSISVPL